MSLETLSRILYWAAPPVLGAIIGLFSAIIAGRMLFHPAAEVRVFGIRIPFTPGILPKYRGRVARGIGLLLSRSLGSQGAAQDLVGSEKLQERLRGEVSAFTSRILERPVSEAIRPAPEELSVALQPVLAGLLSRFLNSRDFIYAVRDILSRVVAALSAKKAGDLLSGIDLRTAVAGRLLPQLAEKPNRESIARSIASFLGHGQEGFLSDDLLKSLPVLLQPLVPAAADRVVEWLKSPDTRAVLSARGRELLPRILEQLNVLQRLLLSAGQFDRRLDEKMPEVVDETIRTLEQVARDPVQQGRFVLLLVDMVRDLRAGQAESLLYSLVESLLARLDDPGSAGRLYELLEERLLAGEPTLGRVARLSFGVQDSDAVDFLAGRILTYLSRPETAASLSGELAAMIARFLGESGQATIGGLLLIDQSRKQRLDGLITSGVIEFARTRLSGILTGLDIEGLVAERIGGMDLGGVERLFQASVAPRLMLFSAVAGLLIGAVEILARLLG